MGTALELDTARLRRLASGLDAVARALSAAAGEAVALDPLGSHRLAAALEDLHHGWRVRRSQLCHDVDVVRDRALAAADGFDTAERSLARSLSGRHR